jgi:hypothetical protein
VADPLPRPLAERDFRHLSLGFFADVEKLGMLEAEVVRDEVALKE